MKINKLPEKKWKKQIKSWETKTEQNKKTFRILLI